MRNIKGHAKRGLVLALVLAGVPACAPEPQSHATEATASAQEQRGSAATAWPPHAKYVEALRARAKALAARDDSRSMLAAALVLATLPTVDGTPRTPDWGAPGARDALEAARQRAPDDPLLAWVELYGCSASCDPQPILARLRRLEPDNAALWLHFIEAASGTGDQRAAQDALHRAAQARQYSWQAETLGPLLLGALRGLEIPPPTSAQRAAMGAPAPTTIEDQVALEAFWVTALGIPPLHSVKALCFDADQRPVAERRSDCVALGTRLAQAPDLISASIGTSFLVDLTAGTPAQASWSARRRQLFWVQHRAFPLIPASADYWRAVFRDGEVRAMEDLMRAHGESLVPPADWEPKLYSRKPVADA